MTIFKKIAEKIETTNISYLVTIFFFIAFLIYFPSLFNGFVWDDEEQILKNGIIQNINNLPYLFTSSTFNTGGAGLSGFYYKPFMPLSFMAINSLFGLNSFFYHFFDLSLHFINSCLIFIFFVKILSYFKAQFSKTISFFLSLIFIVHPANAESVVYISSTQELLYVFFLMLAMLLTFRFLTIKKSSFLKVLIINLFVLFSLLSKESGITAIPLIILLTSLLEKSKIRTVSISLALTFAFYLILRFPIAKTPMFQESSIIPIANASLISRLMTIPFELFSYIRLIFFPLDLFVAQHFVVSTITDPKFYLSITFLIIFLIGAFFISKKDFSKLRLFFLGWTIFSFFLFLNIYPLDMTIAERWLYSPMIGILGFIGTFLSTAMNNQNKKIFVIIPIFILIILSFSCRTLMRTFDWKNNLTLFSHDIKYVPNSFDAQNNLGVALFNKGDLSSAKKHFEISITLSPNWWTSYSNLGVVYQRQEKVKEAKKLYEKSIENGKYYLAFENLAALKMQTESPESTLSFTKASLKFLPENETLNKITAYLLYNNQATEEAKPYALKAYDVNPTSENYLILKSIFNQ